MNGNALAEAKEFQELVDDVIEPVDLAGISIAKNSGPIWNAASKPAICAALSCGVKSCEAFCQVTVWWAISIVAVGRSLRSGSENAISPKVELIAELLVTFGCSLPEFVKMELPGSTVGGSFVPVTDRVKVLCVDSAKSLTL